MRNDERARSWRLAPAVLIVLASIAVAACNEISGLNELEFVLEPSGTGGTGGTGSGGSHCGDPGTDCPLPDGECERAVCVMGECATEPVSAMMPVSTQVAGDCKQSVCDGMGGVTAIDDTGDFKDDRSECTSDSCKADGSTAHDPVVLGTSCTGPSGMQCNDIGACVECIDNGGCMGPETCGGGGSPWECGCTYLCTTPWANRYGDGGAQQVNEVAADSAGAILVIGANSGTIEIAGQSLAQGADDFFIAKLDKDGGDLWAKALGGPGIEIGESIAVDAMDNVLVAGGFDTTLDFLGNQLTSAGGADLFVAKIEKDGNAVWSKSFGGTGDQRARDVAVDAAGGVLVTGGFTGDLTFGGDAYSSMGGDDVFVAKLDSNGGDVWSKQFGGPDEQAGFQIVTDTDGNVLVAGMFRGDMSFDVATPLTTPGDRDIFVAKLDGIDGSTLWSKSFGDDNDQIVGGLAVTADGSVILTGRFSGVVNFGVPDGADLTADGEDIFVARLDGTNGTHQWSRRFGGPGVQVSQSVAVDGAGGVVFSGFFENDLDFGTAKLTSAGPEDLFIAKLDAATGSHLASRRFGDSVSQIGSSCVTVDAADDVLLAASFDGAADFGLGTLASAGGTDLFLAKLTP